MFICCSYKFICVCSCVAFSSPFHPIFWIYYGLIQFIRHQNFCHKVQRPKIPALFTNTTYFCYDETNYHRNINNQRSVKNRLHHWTHHYANHHHPSPNLVYICDGLALMRFSSLVSFVSHSIEYAVIELQYSITNMHLKSVAY